MGLTPFLLLLFGLSTVAALAVVTRRVSPFARSQLVLALSVLSCWFLIAVDGRGVSAFMVLWLAPGGNSIRSPMRIDVILGIVVIVIVFRQCQWWLERWQPPRKAHTAAVLASLAVFSLLFLEQQRDDPSRWSLASVTALESGQAARAISAGQCDAFVLVANGLSGADALELRVDAAILAATTGIPTPLGYSGGGPDLLLDTLAGRPDATNFYGDWMRSQAWNGRMCAIDWESSAPSSIG